MDVAASIVGLIIAGGTVHSTLAGFISACRDAPAIAEEICNEMQDFRYALCRLRARITKKTEITPLGGAATDATQLAVTLAACNLTFSELEKIVERLAPKPVASMSVRNRVRWAWENSNLATLLRRIQQHKSSLTLFLSIWNSDSSADAESMVDSLNDLILELTVVAKAISIKPPPSTLYGTPESESPGLDDPSTSTVTPPTTPDGGAISMRTMRTNISFTSVLRKCRPYRNPDMLSPTPSSFSLSLSQRRGTQWSTFSIGSNTSVFCLPFEDFKLSDKSIAEEPRPLEIMVPVHTMSLHNKEQYSIKCQMLIKKFVALKGEAYVEEALIKLCETSSKEKDVKGLCVMLVKLDEPEIFEGLDPNWSGDTWEVLVFETAAEYGTSHLMENLLEKGPYKRGELVFEGNTGLVDRCVECALRGLNRGVLEVLLCHRVSHMVSDHITLKVVEAAKMHGWVDLLPGFKAQ